MAERTLETKHDKYDELMVMAKFLQKENDTLKIKMKNLINYNLEIQNKISILYNQIISNIDIKNKKNKDYNPIFYIQYHFFNQKDFNDLIILAKELGITTNYSMFR